MGFFRRKSKKNKNVASAGETNKSSESPKLSTAQDDTVERLAPGTPVLKKLEAVSTPATDPIEEKGEREEDDNALSESNDETAKKLLDDLNMLPVADSDDGLELVLGDAPIPKGSIEETKNKVENQSASCNMKPTATDQETEEPAASTDTAGVFDNNAASGGPIETEKDAVDPRSNSPLESKETDPINAITGNENTAESPYDGPDDVSRKLLQVFQCVDMEEQIGSFIPKSMQRMVPSTCQPKVETEPKRQLVRGSSYYNEQFAVKFLDELLNVGYALVYHQPSQGGEDWIGRSVTLILRPGICNAQRVVPPKLEFTTMGGGKDNETETRGVELLDIHSIATSANGEETRDETESEDSELENLQCFFTLTTNNGEVHIMEAINPDESQRLVTGIKNLSARLSSHLIAGDTRAMTEFYDNQGEPSGIKFTPEEAMVRLSHSFFD